MPEGPEIKLAADKLADALVGHKTTRVLFAFNHLRKFENRLTNKIVTSVQTRGKAILTCFENEWVIYSHNQLYGRWYIRKAGQVPDTNRQLRLAIHNDQHSALLYSASDVEVVKASTLEQHHFLSRLGPDILSEHPSVETITERLDSKPFRKRQFASLLLDQGFVAGPGNYLRAEILIFAKLHPQLRPMDCNKTQLKRLATQILKITRRAYKTKGVTNPPGLVRKLKNTTKSTRKQYRFNVYARQGQRCYQCNTVIKRISAGGRYICFCSNCQPLNL